jgi:hypothetical protein
MPMSLPVVGQPLPQMMPMALPFPLLDSAGIEKMPVSRIPMREHEVIPIDTIIDGLMKMISRFKCADRPHTLAVWDFMNACTIANQSLWYTTAGKASMYCDIAIKYLLRKLNIESKSFDTTQNMLRGIFGDIDKPFLIRYPMMSVWTYTLVNRLCPIGVGDHVLGYIFRRGPAEEMLRHDVNATIIYKKICSQSEMMDVDRYMAQFHVSIDYQDFHKHIFAEDLINALRTLDELPAIRVINGNFLHFLQRMIVRPHSDFTEEGIRRFLKGCKVRNGIIKTTHLYNHIRSLQAAIARMDAYF